MRPGKILVAEQDGAFIVKFVGDVRLTLCTTIDDYFDAMLSQDNFASVLIDLSQAEGLDSTTLGLLAKLSIQLKKAFHFIPVVISPKPGITRILDSMGFQQIFDIRSTRLTSDEELAELPLVNRNDEAVRETVLEAHKVLMGMNASNNAEFSDLVKSLSNAS